MTLTEKLILSDCRRAARLAGLTGYAKDAFEAGVIDSLREVRTGGFLFQPEAYPLEQDYYRKGFDSI